MDVKHKFKKMNEIIMEEIMSRIQSGQLAPGDQLDSVQQLAETFGVARSTVREALSALSAMGVIELRHGEGTFVKGYDPARIKELLGTDALHSRQDLLEFFELRKMMETSAVKVAAQKRTEDDLQQLYRLVTTMKESIDDETKAEAADVEFHLTIARATQNKLFYQLMNEISDTLRNTMKKSRTLWLFSQTATTERLYQEHLSIYQALVAQDVTSAEVLMNNHLTQVERVLMK